MTRSSRSTSTASSASLDHVEMSYRDGAPTPSRYAAASSTVYHDEPSDEALDAQDEEEQVGLMPRDTLPRAAPTAPYDLESRTRKSRLWRQHKGVIIIASSLVALPAFVYILAWLASNSSHLIPTQVSTIAVQGPSVATETIPDLPSIGKWPASTNDAAGLYGIKYAPGFALNEAVAGWTSPKEADAALRLPKGTSKQLLAKEGRNKLNPTTWDVSGNGTLRIASQSLDWCAEDKDDGVFMKEDPSTGDIIFEDVTHGHLAQTGQGKVAPGGGKVTVILGKDVVNEHGKRLHWDEFHFSPDLSHVMFFTKTQSVWRHSKKFNVWVHNIEEKKTYPVGGQSRTISHAAWIPQSSSSLAYVQNNDLYVALDPEKKSPIRITNDGTDTIFNAVTDWAYEEEVFSSNHAMWFSPEGTKLAYLRFDETKVPIYEFPIYNNDNYVSGKTSPYLSWVQMRYPKPGFPNPTVTAHLVDINKLQREAGAYGDPSASSAQCELVSPQVVTPASKDATAHAVDAALNDVTRGGGSERLITEVAWLDEDQLYIRETNRFSDKMRSVIFDTKSREANRELVGTVVRREDVGDKSWIDATQDLMPLGAKDLSLRSSAYLEVLPDAKGFKHLAFFHNASSAEPLFLTSGEWEIDKLLYADLKRRKAYISAGYPLPYRRHIFSVQLPDLTKPATQTSDADKGGFVDLTAKWPQSSFTASFDPKGAYYLLEDIGPSLPSSRVLGIDDASFEWVLEHNARLRNASAVHVKAQSVYYNVTLDSGVTTTVHEIRPHDFDSSGATKYPVLFNVYGGPESQLVSNELVRADTGEIIANELGYIYAIVDGRSTGFKGKSYRDPVTRQLGSVEVDDLIDTARKVRQLAYVDEKRLGIWGWSYGGFFTAKVIERDSGVLNLGMAVAPVTNFLFYDSIYTERYMKSAKTNGNAGGYDKTAVHVTEGFKHAHFLLAQGSADDNVHFQNSAHLLDMLTARAVRGFWFRMFTDSDHSIRTRGAYRELQEYLADFLKTKWGPGGKRRFGPSGAKGAERKKLTAEHGKRGVVDADDGLEREREQRRAERQERDTAHVRGVLGEGRRQRRGWEL